MKKWLRLVLVSILLGVFWAMAMKDETYPEPHEALLAVDNKLLLIPSYKLDNKALFFFIKDGNNLGAAYVNKNIFGWKSDVLTWSPMDHERKYENLSGSQGHGGNLIYGLIRHGDERMVKIDETDANILDLEAKLTPSEVEKFQLKGLYLWYLESDQPLDRLEIKLLNENTGEEIEI